MLKRSMRNMQRPAFESQTNTNPLTQTNNTPKTEWHYFKENVIPKWHIDWKCHPEWQINWTCDSRMTTRLGMSFQEWQKRGNISFWNDISTRNAILEWHIDPTCHSGMTYQPKNVILVAPPPTSDYWPPINYIWYSLTHLEPNTNTNPICGKSKPGKRQTCIVKKHSATDTTPFATCDATP